MDNRRMVTGMLVAVAVTLIWLQVVLPYLYKRYGYDMTARPTTQVSEATGAASAPATTEVPAASATTAPVVAGAGMHVVSPTSQPASLIYLGSSDRKSKFKMNVAISPQAAGLEAVVLNESRMTAEGDEPYTFQRPYPGEGSASRSLASRSLVIDGATIDLSAANWTLEQGDDRSATFAVTIAGESGPVARVRKTYQLSTASDPDQGYELSVTQGVENLTDRPISIKTTVNGPTLPPREQDRGGERQILSGFDIKGVITATHDMIESFTKDKPTREYAKNPEGQPLAWIGTSSIYFNALIRPVNPDNPSVPGSSIEKVTASLVNPDTLKGEDHDILITLTTTEVKVPPNQAASIPLRAYFGPRQRSVLNASYYSQPPLSYNETLVLTSGPCAVCTFQWLIDLLVMLLRAMHYILRDWGLAIIGLVVLVRALLHPITKRSQISMSRMSKMGPEMERLKKKYGDNKDELNKAMMQFYKEQGVTPILGCLPMFLQMPIWIALWQSLQTTFELRHAPFLHPWGIPLTWIYDLSKPDHLLTLNKPIPLMFGWQLSALNLLPFLLAIVFWLQSKFQPKPAAMTPEQQQQQKMMQWMTLLFPLMLYTGPSGLNLYILTSTGIGIIESKIVRDHIKQREEEEKAGRVIVDAGRKFKGGGGSILKKNEDRPRSGGPMGWIANLIANVQERAEQVRREADKRK